MASADVDPSIFLSFSRKGRWIASSCQCVIAETLTVICTSEKSAGRGYINNLEATIPMKNGRALGI